MATCGIYKITNMVNGKVYIGQSVDIEKRWRRHKNLYLNYDEILYKAMRKYGFENFSFEILIECEEGLLDLMEIYYIKQYNSFVGWKDNWGYNATTGGGRPSKTISKSKKQREALSKRMKGVPKSEEHKRKIGIAHKGEKNHMWGKIVSEETRKKISEAKTGTTMSSEAKKKMSEANKRGNNSSAIRVVCNSVFFTCIKDCAEYYQERSSNMRRWLKGTRKMPQKFIDLGLRYATQEENDFYKEIQQIKMLNKKIDI